MDPRFQFEYETVDTTSFPHSSRDGSDEGYEAWGGVAVAAFDGNGVPEFVTGGCGGGFLHLYDCDGAGAATRRPTWSLRTSAPHR